MRRVAPLLLLAALALALAPVAGAASRFSVRGAGYGHGVGMSQYGAYGYALHGARHRSILAHYYAHTVLGAADPETPVRVLIGGGPSALFGRATRVGGRRVRPSARYRVRRAGDGLSVSTEDGRLVGRFGSTVVARGPAHVAYGGRRYRGALVFRAVNGGVQVVNRVALDAYVRGVVAGEMPAYWAREALRAQAVAARTYALATRVAGDGFDLYKDTRSQVYAGVVGETPRTDAAVAATRGEVVTYRGRAVVTYFSASSGGRTENVEDSVLGGPAEPWLRSVPDPYDAAGGNPYHRWGPYRLTRRAAARRLGGIVRGTLLGIRVLARGRSPRVLRAAVLGTRGRTIVSGRTLKARLGLRDTWVYFSSIPARPRRARRHRHRPAPRRHARRPRRRSGGAAPRATTTFRPPPETGGGTG